MARPVVIGVTGGIGAGKSAAVQAFADHGAEVFSADRVVHELYDTQQVRDAVRARFGGRALASDGSIDRRVVADIVFTEPEQLQWLEGLLHPLVAQEWQRFLEGQQSRADAPPLVVAEVPLLFEAGLDDRYDATVLITAPLATRLERVGARAAGGSHADSRAARQMPEHEKARRADYVYSNEGSLDDLRAFVARVVHEMLAA